MLKFCVLGGGIPYTLSPLIHRTVFRFLGVDADYAVEDIPSEELAANLPRLLDEYDGFNVTKPHKAAVLPFLLEKNTELDAVNVVDCGSRAGYNTDLDGFMDDLTEFAGDVCGRNTLVLGAGGAAEAVVCGLAKAGADVTVVNRSFDRAKTLAEKFGAKASDGVNGLKPELLVNCTSVGNDGRTSAFPTGLDCLKLTHGYDLVYSPPKTAFMTDCARAGAKASNGLGMLLRQAVLADEIFLGKKLDRAALLRELERAVQKELI